MKIGVIAAALVGLALFVWLLFHIGIESVWEAVAKVGFGLAITQLRASATPAPYVDGLILGTLLLVPGIAAFVILQQRGSALAERLAGRFLPAALKHTAAFGDQMRVMYDSPGRLALSSTIHLLSWIAASGLIWLS